MYLRVGCDMVALTGRRPAGGGDCSGSFVEIVRALRCGAGGQTGKVLSISIGTIPVRDCIYALERQVARSIWIYHVINQNTSGYYVDVCID